MNLAKADSLNFNWLPSSGFDYSVNVYINNELQKPQHTNQENFSVEGLQEGDCSNIIVRNHKGGSNFNIHYVSDTQCVPVTNFNELDQFISLDSFSVNNQNFKFQKISNRLYSGVYEYKELANNIKIHATSPRNNSIIHNIKDEPFISHCTYKLENGQSVNVGNNLNIYTHDFNSLGSHGTFILNDVHGESVTGIIQYQAATYNIEKINIEWGEERQASVPCYISPKISNNLKAFEYSLYTDSEFDNLYLTGSSLNGSANFHLPCNQDFYLKAKPNPVNNCAEEYIHPHVITYQTVQSHKANENKIQSLIVNSNNVGQYSLSASMTRPYDNNSYFQLAVVADGDVLISGNYDYNLTDLKFNAINESGLLDNVHANLHLYDNETDTLLDSSTRSICVDQPRIDNLSVDFDYHAGFHTLNIQTNLNESSYDFFDIYYSGLQNSSPILYTGQDIKHENKFADYNVYITNKNSSQKLNEKHISSRALKPRILLGNKSNDYFASKAIFHVTNAYQRVDNISTIKVYRGPIGTLVSGSSPRTSQSMYNTFNIEASPKYFYQNLTEKDFIDSPDETTHEQLLYTGHYTQGSYEEHFTYYSGQSYQSIFVPINAFEAGAPIKIKYTLGLNN